MKKIPVEKIEDNMVLDREVCGTGGNTLLTKGTILSRALGRRLQNWGIAYVYVQGEEEFQQEESVVTVSPEDLMRHLSEKFANVMDNPYMQKICNAVYHYRLNKSGK
ncbi:MAG: hypothetical protein JXA18_10555 [Chitinispirillaceae bacterium]|nr:hypothetical protein [Chitinispirillaceae bacterium]